MIITPSSRAGALCESVTLAVTARAAALRRQGVDIIGFGAGEPDFDTPEFIRDAAKAALDAGQTRYTPTPSYPELRSAISEKLQRENSLNYSPRQISVGAGGKFCLFAAFLAVIDPGDEVLIPSPHWVSYPQQVLLAGGIPRFVRAEESAGFKLTPEQLDSAISDRTRVLVLNSPCNPTGQVYSRAELAALADVVAGHPRVVVFSDEIYEKFIYGDAQFTSFASLRSDLLERVLVFNCHSKSFAMTGWRVGYVAGPQPIIDAINNVVSHTISHITSFCQMPAATALTDPRGREGIQRMRAEFEKRGQRMWSRLNELPGITCLRPQGAFYCFPNINAYLGTRVDETKITDAVSFADSLLEHAHVAVVPGNDSGFPTHIRLSFATGMEQIDEGIDRIEKFLSRLR
ncbi:MAG: pyridoxal phosphate-dependent aminotransferase [Tepidisphaeraceae bacterium]